MERLILRASAGEVHEVGADRRIDAAEGGLLLAQNRAGKGAAERIGGVEAVAGEVDDAGVGDIGEVAVDRGLGTSPSGSRGTAAIRYDCRVDGVEFGGIRVQRRIGVGAVGKVRGIADVIGIDTDGKCGANIAYVIDREHAAQSHLALDPSRYMGDARSAERGRQQAAEVTQAGDRVNVGARWWPPAPPEIAIADPGLRSRLQPENRPPLGSASSRAAVRRFACAMSRPSTEFVM